jgi:hypothetical protein
MRMQLGPELGTSRRAPELDLAKIAGRNEWRPGYQARCFTMRQWLCLLLVSRCIPYRNRLIMSWFR